MKKTILFLLILCSCININLQANTPPADTIIQNYHRADQIKPGKKEALIRVKVTDFKRNKLKDIPLWVHNNKGQYWHGTSDENGEVFFLLPINQKYLVNVDQDADYRKFSVPKEAKYFKTVKVVYMTSRIKESERNDTVYQQLASGMMPTASRVLVKIKIANLEDRPLQNEILYFEAQNAKKVYHSSTDAQGQSTLMLPKGDTYCIHSYAFRDITCKTFEESNTSRTSRFELNTISTSEFVQRERERAALLARRDSMRREQRRIDSMMIAANQYRNFYLQHKYDDRDFKVIESNIKQAAQNHQAAFADNENYYNEIGHEIKAMMMRNQNDWNKKRIIANIDCSMYEYIDELMVLNYADETEQQNNSYWLFNGFNYKDESHTGFDRRGIFEVPQNTVEGFFNTIDKIVNFSCRGSRLENVVEALILGAKGKNPDEELLFIADNYSDVSDLHLLNKLTVPVHVLLTQSTYGVNENYLEIAYHTGGSIHTDLEDITADQLKSLKDGQLLTIGQHQYTFFKGKFLKSS